MLTNGGATTVVAVAELLAGLGSVCVAETEAVLLSVLATADLTTTVIVALAPLAMVPRLAVNELLVTEMPPCVVELVTMVSPAGRDWFMITLVAMLGPRLVTLKIGR